MNTTIMYSFPDDLKYRYMSFNTYQQALKCIELFKQINQKAEVKVSQLQHNLPTLSFKNG